MGAAQKFKDFEKLVTKYSDRFAGHILISVQELLLDHPEFDLRDATIEDIAMIVTKNKKETK